jgi:ABC-2 type transport system ATP-binding protein
MLHEGRVIALDTPAGLIAAHPGALLSAPVRGDRSVRDRLRAMAGVRHAWLFGDDVHVALEPAACVPARAEFGAAGIDPSTIRRIEPALEDVFLALTADPADG